MRMRGKKLSHPSSLSRRDFLRYGISGLGALALHSMLKPSLLLAQSPRSASGKNVVIINLVGGMDGIAALPYYDGAIVPIINTELRPTLFVPANTVISNSAQTGMNAKIGFHPSFKPLTDVAADRLKIIQGYGIVGEQGRSHDTCQILMSLGASRLSGGEEMIGFMARLMDSQNWETMQYWAISAANASDTNTTKKPPVNLNELASFDFPRTYFENEADLSLITGIQQQLLELQIPRNTIGSKYKGELQALQQTVATVRTDIATQSVGSNTAGNYDEYGIGGSLRDAAKILKAKSTLPSLGLTQKDMLILMSQTGYDTHSDQNTDDLEIDNLAKLNGTLARNLAVFYKDLERFELLENTIVIAYSEFGRTNFENGTPNTPTVGTDHGQGSNTFVLGGPVTAGVVGDPPTGSELRDSEFNAQLAKIDYRDIFSDALAWLGLNPADVFADPDYVRQALGLFS